MIRMSGISNPLSIIYGFNLKTKLALMEKFYPTLVTLGDDWRMRS